MANFNGQFKASADLAASAGFLFRIVAIPVGAAAVALAYTEPVSGVPDTLVQPPNILIRVQGCHGFCSNNTHS